MSSESFKILETTWPDSIPHDDEGHILSIVCGNSHLHWGYHNPVKLDLKPALFWRTPHMKKDDTDKRALSYSLVRHLPQVVSEYIYGRGAETTTEAAERQAQKRKNKLKVFILSVVREQTERLFQVWSSVPSDIYKLKASDFFSHSQGAYDGIGLDRLAAIAGAVDIQGNPALVFDAGTAMTYTATNSSGHLIGGGIAPGMEMKFASLYTRTDALPAITPQHVLNRVKEAVTSKQPIETFAKSTVDAIISCTLSEYATNSRRVIGQWLQVVGKPEPKAHAKRFTNRNRLVFVTGGDGEILNQLLKERTGDALETKSVSTDDNLHKEYPIMHQKHLIHYGIAAAIMKHVRFEKYGNSDVTFTQDEENEQLMGARVAKKFEVQDSEGNFVYRGTITSIQRSDEPGETPILFNVKYDDGDEEQVDIKELQEMLKLFQTYGERGVVNGVQGDIERSQEVLKSMRASAENVRDKTESSKKRKPNPAKVNDAALSTPKKGKKNTLETPVKPPSATPNTNSGTPSEPGSSAKKRTRKKVELNEPGSYVKKRVAKKFGKEIYFGTIQSFEIDEGVVYWQIVYDDGDSEDYDEKDMVKNLALYEKHSNLDIEENVDGRLGTSTEDVEMTDAQTTDVSSPKNENPVGAPNEQNSNETSKAETLDLNKEETPKEGLTPKDNAAEVETAPNLGDNASEKALKLAEKESATIEEENNHKINVSKTGAEIMVESVTPTESETDKAVRESKMGHSSLKEKPEKNKEERKQEERPEKSKEILSIPEKSLSTSVGERSKKDEGELKLLEAEGSNGTEDTLKKTLAEGKLKESDALDESRLLV